MQIKHNTLTINGVSKKIKEDGRYGEYVWKVQKSQIRVQTIEQFETAMLDKDYKKGLFLYQWDKSLKIK